MSQEKLVSIIRTISFRTLSILAEDLAREDGVKMDRETAVFAYSAAKSSVASLTVALGIAGDAFSARDRISLMVSHITMSKFAEKHGIDIEKYMPEIEALSAKFDKRSDAFDPASITTPDQPRFSAN